MPVVEPIVHSLATQWGFPGAVIALLLAGFVAMFKFFQVQQERILTGEKAERAEMREAASKERETARLDALERHQVQTEMTKQTLAQAAATAEVLRDLTGVMSEMKGMLRSRGD